MKNPFSSKAAPVAEDLNEQLSQLRLKIETLNMELGEAKEAGDMKVSAELHVQIVEAQREAESLEAQIRFRNSQRGKAELAAREKAHREKQGKINQAWKNLDAVVDEFDSLMADFKETTSDLIEKMGAVAGVDEAARTQIGIARAALKTVIEWHGPQAGSNSTLVGRDLTIKQFLKRGKP